MRSKRSGVIVAVLVCLGLPAAASAAEGKAKAPKLSAAQIVEKHVAARGGLQAWRAVQSLVVNGELEVGYGDSVARSRRYVSDVVARTGKGAHARRRIEPQPIVQKQVQVPFVLERKRPAKSRMEIEFGGKTAIQLFDGSRGWLLRPYLNRDDWEPFSAEQAKSEQAQDELDGPLVDATVKGTKVELAGVERVEGRDAYKLTLTRKDGEVQHVWIDAKTFLDVKVEGRPRQMDGKLRTVWVTQRDFRQVQGLMVPFVLETAVEGYADTHKMLVEKVAVNRPLDDARFSKPRS